MNTCQVVYNFWWEKTRSDPSDKRAKRNFSLGCQIQMINSYFDHEYSLLVKEKVNPHVRLVNNKTIKKFETREMRKIKIDQKFETKAKQLAMNCSRQLSDFILSLKMKELSIS